MRLHRTVMLGVAVITCLIGQDAWAGTLKGKMFNLPRLEPTPTGGREVTDPLDDDETIVVRVRDRRTNEAVVVFDSSGNVVSNAEGEVTLTGSKVELVIQENGSGQRALRLEFFRGRLKSPVDPKFLTQTLEAVIVPDAGARDRTGALIEGTVLNISVPTPDQMGYSTSYRVGHCSLFRCFSFCK